MNRVAGTPEARRAWIALRGPYLVAYLGLLMMSVFMVPVSVQWDIWRYISGMIGAILVVGSVASYVVVSSRKPARLAIFLSVLEVTGLRALWMFELAFFLWGSISGYMSLRGAIPHLVLAALSFGVLQAMTWNKGRLLNGR